MLPQKRPNMIHHYLKVALRNLLKYKTQSSISILCLAVGMVCFSMTNYFLARLDGSVRELPDLERRVYLLMETPSNPDIQTWMFRPSEIQQVEERSMKFIEKMGAHSFREEAEFVLIDMNQKETPYMLSHRMVNSHFFDVYNSKLLYASDRPLQEHEAVLSKSCALRLFGESNPIGSMLAIPPIDPAQKSVQYFKIVNVAEDIPEEMDAKADVFLYYKAAGLNYSMQVQALVTPGATEESVNQELKNISLSRGEAIWNLKTQKVSDRFNDSGRIFILTFITFLSSLVLISGIIHFLKFIIQSFHNRSRELTLRKSMGASFWGLCHLLFAEIGWVLMFSLLLSLLLSELLSPLLTSYIPESEGVFNVELADLFLIHLKLFLLLLLMCLLITLFTVYRLKRKSILIHLRQNAHRHLFRNVMMGVQLTVCIFFMGAAIAVHLGINEMNHALYSPITNAESKCIVKIDLNSTSINQHVNAILSQIEMLPGVAETTYVNKSGSRTAYTYVNYVTSDNRTLDIGIQQGNPNYFEFFRIPHKGKKTEANDPYVVYVSEFFQQQLLKDSITDMVKLGKDTYRIIGTYQALYKEDRSGNSYQGTVFFPGDQKNSLFVRIGTDKKVKEMIQGMEKICRLHVPETLPLSIYPLNKEKEDLMGALDMIRDIALLLAIVSVLLVILSIYSAIAMDTTNRQKEVAIRKINGANSKTIALMFGKVYLNIFLISFLLAYPLLRLLLIDLTKSQPLNSFTDFGWGIALFAIIAFIIVVTTGYRIYKIMHINPAEIIKNE